MFYKKIKENKMKKIIMFIALAMTLSIGAETVTFTGAYHSDERKAKAEDRKGFVGGCIYNGKASNGKLIKVYTQEVCPTQKTSKVRTKGTFVCEVTCDQCENGRKQEYLMYEGTCKESD
jgi:hypothetical protein